MSTIAVSEHSNYNIKLPIKRRSLVPIKWKKRPLKNKKVMKVVDLLNLQMK